MRNKILLLTVLICMSSCRSIHIGEINAGFFSIRDIDIVRAKTTSRPVVGKGKTLKAATSECYYDGLRRYNAPPNHIDSLDIYLKTWLFGKETYIVKAQGVFQQ